MKSDLPPTGKNGSCGCRDYWFRCHGGIPLGLAVMDFSFLAATMGSVVGEKITRIIEASTKAKRPVIIVCASGGARMYEGMLSLMQMAKTSGALARHAEAGLPYIAVLTNPTTAGVMASFATLGDITLAEPKAMIGFAGPRVIRETTHQELPPDSRPPSSCWITASSTRSFPVQKCARRSSRSSEILPGSKAPVFPMGTPDPEPSGEDPMEWLDKFQGRGIVPGLERMERLLAALGNPERSLRCLHVAGTNGKGSVCAFAESVLREGGYSTGLYTSPHLVRFAERIRINGQEVDALLLGEGIDRLKQATEGWPEEEMPTYFELVTALAFDLFARANLDVIVLETGLGGRLDATNTPPKLACAITPIGLDHMEWLGPTLGAIAREKAGILRPGIPAVTAPRNRKLWPL